MFEFTKGALIECIATFTSVDVPSAVPDSAGWTIAFHKKGVLTRKTIPLTLTSGKWLGNWDSSEADGGKVDYFIKSLGGVVAAKEGTIVLESNKANV
jgi:hypothetical protein